MVPRRTSITLALEKAIRAEIVMAMIGACSTVRFSSGVECVLVVSIISTKGLVVPSGAMPILLRNLTKNVKPLP